MVPLYSDVVANPPVVRRLWRNLKAELSATQLHTARKPKPDAVARAYDMFFPIFRDGGYVWPLVTSLNRAYGTLEKVPFGTGWLELSWNYLW